MPYIQLLDGKKIPFSESIDGFELTKKISKSLEKVALIMEVNGELKDLSFKIKKDSKVKIITAKDKEGLEVIRHDAAHIMAMAVQEIFPETQVTIGPVIENGFFYDFARKDPFTSQDLKKIENKMSEIIDRNVKTRREVWDRKKAIQHFQKIGEKYKAEIIDSIPDKEELSIYHHGDKWHDLCRGPHLASSGKIGKFFSKKNKNFVLTYYKNKILKGIKFNLNKDNISHVINKFNIKKVIILSAYSEPDFCFKYKKKSQRVNVHSTQNIIKTLILHL